MSQSPLTITSSPSLNLASDDFKGGTKTGDPPSSPLEQDTVQMLTREDVAVRLMKELEKVEEGGSSKVWDDRENAANEDNVDVDEEDHVDGLLSPTGEVSMIDKQDDERVDDSPVAFERENVSTPLFSDDKQDYISASALPSTAVPGKSESKEDPAPISPIIEGGPTAPAVPPSSTSIARYPMGNRRPKGWISSLNHPRTISNLTDKQIALTPPRSSSTSDLPKAENRARVSSVHVHHQQRGGARRISGTMQYAFTQPQSQRASREGSLHNEEQSEDQDQARNGDGDISIVDDEQGEGEDVVEQLSPEDEARIRYEVGLSQDQDEIWMEYVRNQLSSLFPDFFGANPGQLQSQMGEATYIRNEHQQETESGVYQESQREGRMEGEGEGEGGGQMGMEDGVDRIGSPLFPPEDATSRINGHAEPVSSIDSPSSRRMSTSRNGHDVFSTPANDRSFISTGSSTDFSSLPTPPMRSNADMLRGNVVIPNVRDEISGLREEIERLRSVVGGLAQELGGDGEQREQQNQEVVRENEIDGDVVTAESHEEGVIDDEQSQGRNAMVVQEAEGVESVRVKDEDDQTRENDSQLKEENPETEKEEQVPEAFLKTANISSEIIRLLDSQICKSAKRNTGGSDTRSDEEVFSTMNLEKIMRYVKGLGTS